MHGTNAIIPFILFMNLYFFFFQWIFCEVLIHSLTDYKGI